MNTIAEATDYVIQSLKNVDTTEVFDDVDEDIVSDDIKEGLLDKVETQLDEEDLDFLNQKMDDNIFMEEYLKRRFPNFVNLLGETVQNILTDYLVELEKVESQQVA